MENNSALLAEFKEWRRQKQKEGEDPMAKRRPFLLEMKLWKWHGKRGSNQKGGIGVFLRCPEIEEVFRDISSGRTESPTKILGGLNIDAIKMYKPPTQDSFLSSWPSRESVAYKGASYQPSAHPQSLPIDISYGRVSVAPMAVVGIGDGVTFRADGLYPGTMIEDYAVILPTIMRKFFKSHVKKSEFYVYVTEREISGREAQLAA